MGVKLIKFNPQLFAWIELDSDKNWPQHSDGDGTKYRSFFNSAQMKTF